jgi:UDP:flavonoid glycosyltransferase YjiC (YdhE family)
MSHDQFDNAARIKRLGGGDRINFSEATAPRLAKALRNLIDDPQFSDAARLLAPRIAAEDGAQAAAQAIIAKFAGNPTPPAKGSGNRSQQHAGSVGAG